MGYAKLQQQADDRAEEDKQQMIKKMMTTLKKERPSVGLTRLSYMLQSVRIAFQVYTVGSPMREILGDESGLGVRPHTHV